MKLLFVVSIALVVFASCNNSGTTDAKTASNLKTVLSEDEQMNAAIAKAKNTFRQFDTAFKNGHFDTAQFSLKVRFATGRGAEHIWTYGITYNNNNYYGIIDEDAVEVSNVKKGDKIKVTLENMSDWLYADNGVLRGGYTIRVFRDRMDAEEKRKFDSSYFLKITD